jgi:hypothetical protein
MNRARKADFLGSSTAPGSRPAPIGRLALDSAAGPLFYFRPLVMRLFRAFPVIGLLLLCLAPSGCATLVALSAVHHDPVVVRTHDETLAVVVTSEPSGATIV